MSRSNTFSEVNARQVRDLFLKYFSHWSLNFRYPNYSAAINIIPIATFTPIIIICIASATQMEDDGHEFALKGRCSLSKAIVEWKDALRKRWAYNMNIEADSGFRGHSTAGRCSILYRSRSRGWLVKI